MFSEFIDTFKSVLGQGRKEALNKLLGDGETSLAVSQETIDTLLSNQPTPLTSIPDDLTNVFRYNTALSTIYSDLYSIFSEINSLTVIENSIFKLGQQDLLSVRLAMEDLETRVSQTTAQAFSNKTSFTDRAIETFNTQTKIETDKLFYNNGTIPIALVDSSDGLLKLPVDGEFISVLSNPGIKPSNVFIDRIIGVPASDTNLVNNAFDGTLSNFWNEVLHSTQPIYSTTEQFPWLPTDLINTNVGYKGGAACRIKAELEHTTEISEIDIRPYGQHPINLIAIGWTNEKDNLLLDPEFSFGVNANPSTYWYQTGSGYSTNGGTLTVETGAGPDKQNVVHMSTSSPTGAVFIAHGAFDISTAQGIEVSFLMKSVGDTPIQIGITFSSSGVVLDDRVETVRIDGLGWTKVIMSFDPIPTRNSLTEKVSLRVGIPPTFDKVSDISICDPRIETIKEQLFYKKISSRTTVFLPESIEAKRLYMVFSQENYTFKHYSFDEDSFSQKAYWERLTRRVVTSPFILGWDKEIARGVRSSMPISSSLSFNTGVIRETQGTSWSLLQDIERYAFPSQTQVDFPVYEYAIGAFEIYLRHREYAPNARFVSEPLRINGEIREIQILSQDSSLENLSDPELIEYSVTINEDDVPESSLPITNSLIFQSDTNQYTVPPGDITYLPYTNWSSPGNPMRTISWPTNPADENSRTKEILMVQLESTLTPGMYIQEVLPEELDIRGAAALTFDFFLMTSHLQRLPVSFDFELAVSNDGENWVGQTFSGKFSDRWNINTVNQELVFTKAVMNITAFDASLKSAIKYVKITAKSPTYYSNTCWLAVRRLKTGGYTTGGRVIRFIPSDDIPDTTSELTDYVVPVRHLIEHINGTDRNGRIFPKNYPYLNKTRMMRLIYNPLVPDYSLSGNLDGRRVPFDPNAVNPKYLDSNGQIGTLQGYRPVQVTLTFTGGLVAYPDSLGKPKVGDFSFVEDEVLEEATILQSSTSSSTINQITQTSKTSSTPTDNIQSVETGATGGTRTSIPQQTNQSQQSVERSFGVWQTKYKDLVSGPRGISISCWWANGPSSGDVSIDPLKLKIDPVLGTVQVLQSPPNASYRYIRASYWYFIQEDSPRENFSFENVSADGISNQAVASTFPQKYPVTRNMTDYVGGTTPVLAPVNLDPLSENYYPVFEYYIHPNGYIVFSENMHVYSDRPASVKLEYDSLAITPRVIINLNRPIETNLTPYVDSYSLALNVRRG